MGLPSYTGPASFAEDWRRAVEANGCAVEAIPPDNDTAIDASYVIRLGDAFLNCLGTVSKKIELHRQSPEDLYTLILMLHSVSDDDETLCQDVHQILVAGGATAQAINGGYVLFQSNSGKDELLQTCRDALSTQGFELQITATKHPEAVTRGTVFGDTRQGMNIAEVSIGRSIDLVTREPCSFLAIRTAGLLSRAAGLLSGNPYRSVLELCQTLPLARI